MAEFQSEVKAGAHIILCPPILESTGGSIETNVKSWLIMDVNLHVLDFKNVTEFKHNAYRPFILFNQALKGNAKKLYCINVAAKFHTQIAQDGLGSVFEPVNSVEEAIQKSKRGSPPVARK